MATEHDDQLGEIYPMITEHLALVFHVFIAVAVMVMVCGHCGLWPLWFVALMVQALPKHCERDISVSHWMDLQHWCVLGRMNASEFGVGV